MSVSVLGDIWVFIFQQICQQEQCVRWKQNCTLDKFLTTVVNRFSNFYIFLYILLHFLSKIQLQYELIGKIVRAFFFKYNYF